VNIEIISKEIPTKYPLLRIRYYES